MKRLPQDFQLHDPQYLSTFLLLFLGAGGKIELITHKEMRQQRESCHHLFVERKNPKLQLSGGRVVIRSDLYHNFTYKNIGSNILQRNRSWVCMAPA